jgi:hypothetical protein
MPTTENGPTAATTEQAHWHLADPKTLKVNKAFQALIPLQSKGELLALEESIKAEGCRDPLLIWKDHNVVLDGHTRRELSMRNKKHVKVKEVELVDEKAAIAYILQIQRQRRNLTREAMSYFRGAEYTLLKEPRGGKRESMAKGQTDPLPSTAAKLAAKYGVSEKTIKRDGRFAEAIDQIVAEYGDPEIQRKLLSADVRLTQGAVSVLLKTPAKERKKIVDELVAKGELPRIKKAAVPKPRAKQEAQRYIDRLVKRGDDHAMSVLQHMAQLLGMEVVAKDSKK